MKWLSSLVFAEPVVVKHSLDSLTPGDSFSEMLGSICRGIRFQDCLRPSMKNDPGLKGPKKTSKFKHFPGHDLEKECCHPWISENPRLWGP